MDTTLKSSVTFFTVFLLVSFFISLLPKVSEARPLLSPLQGQEGLIGVFRTLKGDGPSPGVGHRLIGGMKDSGPSSGGVGHRIIGGMKDSGPGSGGVGHKYITNNNNHS
ncbi:unnamed protein product [Lathyrus sativus]|nr:unnamed protein product [Lathyrus sativus]